LLKYEGFALGIGGVLTFKNCHLAETLQHVPLERIVLETDAPYLAPVPHRGKRNEPSFVYNVAQKIAEIYGVPLEEVNSTTNTTVENIFGKL
jgi:TatD DNase family protein